MSVLIIKNVASEGPGTIADYLENKGIKYTILEIYDCNMEVPDVRDYSHLVIMGGPAAVYDIDDSSNMHFETAIIRAFLLSKKPVLGICLGAQMIANALKAEVYYGGSAEVGWYNVDLTQEGMDDPVFSTIAVNNEPYAEVFQWHGDTFKLPKNSVRLSSSEVYENQAFRYKDNVYALQFHIEVKPEMIKEWFVNDNSGKSEEMFKKSEEVSPEYNKRAMAFYDKFFSI